MLLTQAHKLPWALSQILPIAHILSNLGFHKNTHHITTKIEPQNLHFSHTKPNIIRLVGKTQRKPKIPKVSLHTMWLIQSPTTMWLIPKVPLRCG